MPKNLPQRKSGWFKYIFFIIVFLIFGRYLDFSWDFPYLDILHYLRPKMSFEDTMKLINPLPEKGYQYPNPSETALNRIVDCSVLYSMSEFPRKNPLCLNMYQTSEKDMGELVATGNYDRIVLYGELSVFDAPVSADALQDYMKNLYGTVRFMDSIALPKFLSAYGLSDVSYVKATKPYPYLYYRISSLDESDQVCDQEGLSEQVSGCARNYYASVIPFSAVGPQLSGARPVLRKTDKKRFSYLTHYPADCFTNDVFAHETSHLLNGAIQSETGNRVMESWFNEQVAGFFSIYGADLACGEGTVTMQKKPDIKDVPKALAEFNSTFAAASLSHGYPDDNVCRQAILTGWYQWLSKGNYRDNFRKFFVEQRTTTPSIVDDTTLARLLLRLDTDPTLRALLVSKGCIL